MENSTVKEETENFPLNTEANREKPIKYDDYIVHLGEFGRYQKILYALLVLPSFCAAFPTVSVVFTFWETPFRCAVPQLSNDTYAIQGTWHEEIINNSVPFMAKDGSREYSKCKIYSSSNASSYYNDSRPEQMCNIWVYDKSVIQSTVISEMNLVCDKAVYPSHAKMLYFGGLLFGSLVMGTVADVTSLSTVGIRMGTNCAPLLADLFLNSYETDFMQNLLKSCKKTVAKNFNFTYRFGRKPVLCFNAILMLVSNLIPVWVSDFTGFIILRFLSGVANIGCWNAAFIIGLELVGPSKRHYAGIVIEFVWCVGELYLLVMAYCFRNWQDLQLAGSVPIICIVLYCWFLPESPRWLISHGSVKKANKILLKAAKFNKVTLPRNIEFGEDARNQKSLELLPLVKSPQLLTRFIIMCFIWIVASMGYYGLTLNSGNMGGNVYINFFVSVIVEFIGYAICLLFMGRLGRRFVLCASMLLGGVACICTIFTTLYANQSLNWITIALSNVGKCGVSAAFGLIYIYTQELFPTSSRSFILGVLNMVGRIGGVASPYIADLGLLVDSDFGKALPVIIFGSVMFAAGVLALFLPDTLNQKLPENIQDALDLGRKDYKVKPNSCTYKVV